MSAVHVAAVEFRQRGKRGLKAGTKEPLSDLMEKLRLNQLQREDGGSEPGRANRWKSGSEEKWRQAEGEGGDRTRQEG